MPAVAVTIGREVEGVPMSTERWNSFRLELTSLITTLGGTLWVNNSGIGIWDGGIEENHVVIGGLPPSQMTHFRAYAIRLGMKYQQQAIAVLAGISDLVTCTADRALPVSGGPDG